MLNYHQHNGNSEVGSDNSKGENDNTHRDNDNSKKPGTDLFIEVGSGRFLFSALCEYDLTFRAFRVIYRQTCR